MFYVANPSSFLSVFDSTYPVILRTCAINDTDVTAGLMEAQTFAVGLQPKFIR